MYRGVRYWFWVYAAFMVGLMLGAAFGVYLAGL